jgi:PhnB protein
MGVEPIPEGYNTVNAYISVGNASEAIEFYKRAFGAKERARMEGPPGKIAHAELEIGDSVIMLSDQFPQSPTKPPKELGGTSASLMLYVENVDEFVQQAVDAGATLEMPVETQFWGDRYGRVEDPFGHNWQIATHVEDVPPDEMAKRAEEVMGGMATTT